MNIFKCSQCLNFNCSNFDAIKNEHNSKSFNPDQIWLRLKKSDLYYLKKNNTPNCKIKYLICFISFELQDRFSYLFIFVGMQNSVITRCMSTMDIPVIIMLRVEWWYTLYLPWAMSSRSWGLDSGSRAILSITVTRAWAKFNKHYFRYFLQTQIIF